jgi:hypothetical protein
MKKSFEYVSAVSSLADRDRLVVRVPGEIQSAKQLFDFFYESLMLPGYFGFNWNALSDCLRDLHWVNERGVLLAHENIPALPLSEMRIYLEILQDAMLSWREGDEHSLEIVFMDKDRVRIETLLEAPAS